MKIDSHHHFWKYDPVRYSWMNERMEILKRDYQPDDLLQEIERVGIDGVVSVQADQSMQETDELLEHASQHEFIRGVVGWFPLADPAVEEMLAEYSKNPWLKGVRHVVQDEPDDRFILGNGFNEGIRKLKKFDLVYDILIYERQLASSIEFVDLHPGQSFVLDHVAKPRIGDGLMEPWKEQMFELAKRENVTCKLSGMATEANWKEWTYEALRPYMDVALDAFGPDRLMFGSDWPVARLAVDYEPWVKLCREFISSLSQDECEAIEGGNAVRAYRLD
jgi:L-fuconolactonase